MFYVLSVSLSLFARFSRFIFAFDKRGRGEREALARFHTNCSLSLSFFGNANASFSRVTKKKNTSQKVFLFCLAREKEHASARCTRDDDDANDDNERAVRESERFVFSPALFVFISVRGCVFNSNLFGDCR